jgi:hypothetical protein
MYVAGKKSILGDTNKMSIVVLVYKYSEGEGALPSNLAVREIDMDITVQLHSYLSCYVSVRTVIVQSSYSQYIVKFLSAGSPTRSLRNQKGFVVARRINT